MGTGVAVWMGISEAQPAGRVVEEEEMWSGEWSSWISRDVTTMEWSDISGSRGEIVVAIMCPKRSY